MASTHHHPPNGLSALADDPARLACVVGGGLLTLIGARRGGPLGVGLALMGGAVALRGAAGGGSLTGEDGLLQAGVKRLEHTLPGTSTIKIAQAVTIGCPRAEVWRFVRDLAGFPRWAWHVESVTPQGEGGRSRWVVRGPGGTRLSWDAQVEREVENERLSWQSVPGSDIRHAGLISLRDAPGGRGTELVLHLAYDAPGGTLGRTLARLFGEEPGIQARDDLRRLKQLLETGEIATNAMRPEDVGRERF
jgi:uncharacterized membrane protein